MSLAGRVGSGRVGRVELEVRHTSVLSQALSKKIKFMQQAFPYTPL